MKIQKKWGSGAGGRVIDVCTRSEVFVKIKKNMGVSGWEAGLVDVNGKVIFFVKIKKIKLGWGVGSGAGVVLGGQGRCELRSEVL